MKTRIIGGIIAAFFLTIPVWADEVPTSTSMPALPKPVVDARSIVTHLQSQLTLTDKQMDKMIPILDEENKKLSKVLTPDQMSQWMNLLNNLKQKHKKGKHAATKTK